MQIIDNEDTIKALHIDIKDGAKYQSIITLCDICLQDRCAAFYALSLQDDDFLYFHGRKVSDKEKEEQRLRDEEYKKYKNEIHFAPNSPKQNFIDKMNILFHDKDIRKMKYLFVIFIVFSIISMIYTWKKFTQKQ